MREGKIENKFCLIGNGQLLLDCAEALSSQNHHVLAIISTDSKVQSWVVQHNQSKDAIQIRLFLSLETFKSSFHDPFEFLLSIVNYSIIPKDILKIPSRGVINFHAGKLPEHRGVYGTSWAILEQKSNYGITWHLVDEGIDTGSILLQHEVEMEPDDTAFSLEIKCASAARDTFTTLLSLLEEEALKSQIQDESQAKQYTFNDKLPHNGLINWNHNAASILRLYRASVMSDAHPNYIGIIKFLLLGDLYTAERLANTDRKSTHAPGSVVTTKENGLEIATQTTNVILEGIYTLKGNRINVEQLLSLSPSEALPKLEFNTTIAKSLERNEAYQYKNERFWAQQLGAISPIVYPGSTVSLKSTSDLQGQSSVTFPHLTVPLPVPIQGSAEITSIMTLFILFNSLSSLRHSTIGFIDANSAASSAESLFLSSKVPLTLELDKNITLGELRQKVTAQLTSIRSHGRYPYDIVIRHPDLKGVQTELPITFEVVDDNNSSTDVSDSILHFVFNRTTGEMLFYYYPSLLADSHFLNELPHYFRYIFEQVSEQTDYVELSAINVMTAVQKQKLISTLPSALKTAPTIYPQENIVTLFEKIANNSESRNRIALRYRENSVTKVVTYEELNRKVNTLAYILQSQGVMFGTSVMVACQKTEEFIISILAVLKVGGVFVPINPCDTPEDFFQQMFEDLKDPFIITDENSLAFLPGDLLRDKTIINASEHLKYADSILELYSLAGSGNDLAYIIYTSGSTGKPNGVAVTHSNIMYSTLCRIQYYQGEFQDHLPDESFNILPVLSLAFDAATGAIFWALCSGNTLNLLDAESKTPETLVEILNEYRITHLMANPSTYNILLSQVDRTSASFDNLNAVILGGEKWDNTIVQQHKRYAPHSALYDEYGPTENTVWTTVKKVAKKNSFGKHPHPQVTIGHALTPDIRIYVLNKEQKPVPPGVTGELYVSGPQIARGYINREDITASRFIKLNLAEIYGDPFLSTVDTYRTGDLVRYTSQYELEYVGRIDDEAKINGHRVDLTGIVGALKRTPKIREASVLILQNPNNTSCELIAFVVTDLAYTAKNVSHFQESLSRQLPNYMIPRKITFLSEMPITRTGKVDKRKLLALPYTRPSATSISNLKPDNAVEIALVAIWAGLLNIEQEQLPIDANLHDYGLKSISIPRARMQIYNKFHVHLSLPEFFQFPTIQEQARIIIERNPSINSEQVILITGATGFAGLHILLDLIKNTNFKIYCLIRGNKQHQPIQKLFSAMQAFNYDVTLLNHGRVTVVEGDISKPNFGIEIKEYSRLSKEIDAVYHCAAHVNHVLPYEQLQVVNVTGTQNVINFSLAGKNKRLHYVSTLSVSHPGETFVNDDEFSNLSGYARSKREAEKLLSQNRQHGLKVTIYRPSWISGHSQSGKFLEPERDHLLCLTHACAQMGFAPDWSMTIDALPVDIVSRIISAISLLPESDQQVYNVFNPKGISWKEYINLVEKSSGKQIQVISKEEWLRKLRIEFIIEGFPLLPFKDLYLANATWLSEQEIQPPFSFENTIAMLSQLGIQISPITTELLTKYMRNRSANLNPLDRRGSMASLAPPPTIITRDDEQELMRAMHQIVLVYRRLGVEPGQSSMLNSAAESEGLLANLLLVGAINILPSSQTQNRAILPPSDDGSSFRSTAAPELHKKTEAGAEIIPQ
jgi:amino acid adenylation domain-containing protein/thioester reductase-like protein